MSSPETIIRANEPVRPLKRVEYELLAREGCFEDERVELLFGMVVPMTPVDWDHARSAHQIRRPLEAQLGARAMVVENAGFAASDISMPQPDVMVLENRGWGAGAPVRAYLIIEVARTSLRRDQGPKAVLYGLADVDEYWIVDHVHGVIEVYRDRDPGAGTWRTKLTKHRGERVAMLAFPDCEIAVADVVPPIES